jgi:hypothetical protein
MKPKSWFHLMIALALVLSLGSFVLSLSQGGIFMAVNAQAQGADPQGPALSTSLVGTAFTYQGRLTDASGPVTGTCDLTFDLYDEAGSGSPPTGGTLLGTDSKPGVEVSAGLFTVQLDFGAGAFYGEARWLQTTVDCGTGALTLSPRQELTPVPYALALPGLWTQQNATSPNLIGGYSGNSVAAGVYGAAIGGGGKSGETNRVTDIYGTVGGGGGNRVGNNNADLSDATYATVGGGRENTASGVLATVGGGRSNAASGPIASVSGGGDNAASGWAATVGGGTGNYAGANFATVGGGGPENPDDPSPWWPNGNVVTDEYGTVGGGGSNQAGNDNTSLTDAIFATVGGGRINTAGAHYATVSGGRRNQALGWYSVIGGGVGNVATAYAATVPGGWENSATGERSFAAGRRAQARHRGTFVWADDTDADFASTAVNQFLIRASGGVGIGTTNPAAKLHVAGRTQTEVLEITGGSDLAEPFEIAGTENVEPGMVVAIDPQHPGQLRIAAQAYDRTVAGCVSGANGLNPGLTMQQEGTVADGAFPVALSGRVHCWADAAYGAIQPGDLLTTSDTPGHVMRVTDHSKAQGAIIGKAMSALTEGEGLILVLVSLQ